MRNAWRCFCLTLCLCAALVDSKTFSFNFHHKFSPEVQRKLLARGDELPPLPPKGSQQYYQLLHEHDLSRHGRRLVDNNQVLTLLEGNVTYSLFAGLYYTTIDVGTPNVPFLVALDTGSDLFWLPCECQQCAPASSPLYADYGITATLSEYKPSKSSTSSAVSCAAAACDSAISRCTAASSAQCVYEASYISTNTSTSGVLVEDVIYLIQNDGNISSSSNVRVTIGCGQVQTGSFLTGGAPDGLLGLGLEAFSVPSSLANSGLIQDSFSMCFDVDYTGRIVFGDIGSVNQGLVDFVQTSTLFSSYHVVVDSVGVGNTTVVASETALFDTGTTYTYFSSAVYSKVLSDFSAQVTEYAQIQNGVDPWELCYSASDSSTLKYPTVSLTFAGGDTLVVQSPIVTLSYNTNHSFAGFCLAVLQSNSPVIGANFMTGYNLVFNRKELKLGFQVANCVQEHPTSGAPSPILPPSPGPAVLTPIPAPTIAPPTSPVVPPSPYFPIPAPNSGPAPEPNVTPISGPAPTTTSTPPTTGSAPSSSSPPSTKPPTGSSEGPNSSSARLITQPSSALALFSLAYILHILRRFGDAIAFQIL